MLGDCGICVGASVNTGGPVGITAGGRVAWGGWGDVGRGVVGRTVVGAMGAVGVVGPITWGATVGFCPPSPKTIPSEIRVDRQISSRTSICSAVGMLPGLAPAKLISLLAPAAKRLKFSMRTAGKSSKRVFS